MSGEFRPEQNAKIEATDDPDLAKAHGLTQFDKATGQYRAPSAPDAGQRDGIGRGESQPPEVDALRTENEDLKAEIKLLNQQVDELAAEHDSGVTPPPGFTPAEGHAPKGRATKASQSKGDDGK